MLIENLRKETLNSFLVALFLHLIFFSLLVRFQISQAPELVRLKITEIAYLESLEKEDILTLAREIERKEVVRRRVLPPEKKRLLTERERLVPREPSLAEIKAKIKPTVPFIPKPTPERLLETKRYPLPEMPGELGPLGKSAQEFKAPPLQERLLPLDMAFLAGLPREEDLDFVLEEEGAISEELIEVMVGKGYPFLPEGIVSKAPFLEREKEPILVLPGEEGITREFTLTLASKKERKERKEAIAGLTVQVQISGALAGRKVIHSPLPPYPDWAMKQGIEARLRLRFSVLADGKVNFVCIDQTSGYQELDRLSVDFLRKWLFEPLSGEMLWQEQQGLITLVFCLEK